jgi:uncharacterized membrane protein
MARLHLIFGLVLFVAFLATGRFMRWDFPDKEAIAPEFRMLMRSRHIYILLSSLIHIVLGVYLEMRREKMQKYAQIFASVLLFAGSALFIAAFVYETYRTRNFSEISRLALYATLAGTVFHLLGGYRMKT